MPDPRYFLRWQVKHVDVADRVATATIVLELASGDPLATDRYLDGAIASRDMPVQQLTSEALTSTPSIGDGYRVFTVHHRTGEVAATLSTLRLHGFTMDTFIGIPYGVLSGYFGGKVDTVAMRFVDGLLAFPGLLLYLLIVTLAREWKMEGIYNDMVLIFALGFAFTPEVARLSRGSVLVEKQKEYVEASRAIGDGSLSIALRQILPNIVSPLIVNATVRLGYVILIVAALSFLGLGTPPPTPDWGSDLAAARDYMETAPFIAAFPGLAICYTVLAFNLFGDGLRDILDPRLAER